MTKSVKIAVSITVILSAAFVLVTWPMFVSSRSAQLTGHDFEMKTVALFIPTDNVRREGLGARIYRIPPAAAKRLSAADYPLQQCPAWCGLYFDGYRLFRWSRVEEFPDQEILNNVFHQQFSGIQSVEEVRSAGDAADLAAWLVELPDSLVGGWHCERTGNYFFYVLNLEQELLVQVSWLT